jgi:hypothetical protein
LNDVYVEIRRMRLELKPLEKEGGLLSHTVGERSAELTTENA